MVTKTVHPWAKYRKSAGFTQAQAADRVGVTRHMIIRLEQSLFWHPPQDSVLVKLSTLYDIELGTFEMAYYQYVRDRREEYAKTHKDFDTILAKREFPKLHPLVEYRSFYELSRMGLCKAICLHYDPISEWEMNKQRSIPDQLKEACEEMQWSTELLEDEVSKWRRFGYADKL